MALNPDDHLDCGRDLDDVWVGIDQPPDAHQRDCPYCTEARARLRPLADLTKQYRSEQDTSPDLQPGPGLTERILGIARTEVRRGAQLPLSRPGPDGSDDGLTVSEQAVASVARRAADGVAGVQVRRCRVVLPPPGEPAPGSGPDEPAAADATADDGGAAAVAVLLRVSIASTASVPKLEGPIRSAVARAVQRQVGMTTTRIDIAVEDLHDA